METCKNCLHYDICTFHVTGNENEKCTHYTPTADVVPKSEVKSLAKEIDRLSQVVLYNDSVTQMLVEEAKEKVAREIFEEIEKRFEALLKSYPFGGEVTDAKKFVNVHWKYIRHSIMCDYDAELKKKYTEDNNEES